MRYRHGDCEDQNTGEHAATRPAALCVRGRPRARLAMALADETWTPCSEDAVWLAYLRSEWNRVARLNPEADERIVSAANLASSGENDERCRLLATIRWPLIEAIPADTRWFEVHTLRAEHIEELHVIGHCGWDHPHGEDANELTAVSARRQIPLHGDLHCCEPILWGHAPQGPFTILEGNQRLIAWARAATTPAVSLNAYVGLSPSACEWHIPRGGGGADTNPD
jgi:hypothetical protein